MPYEMVLIYTVASVRLLVFYKTILTAFSTQKNDSIHLMNSFSVFYLSCAGLGCIHYFIIYCSGDEIIFILCFLLVFIFLCLVVL